MNLKNRAIWTVSICLTLLSLAEGLGARQLIGGATLMAQTSSSVQAATPVVNTKLIAANTRLSFKLFSEILKQQPDQNIFISPASIAIALAMTYNGAQGQTQQAMAQTLELQGMSLEEVNQSNAALRATLTNPDPQVQLFLANSLWARKDVPFKQQFQDTNQTFYGAQMAALDFNSPRASSIINDWVKQSTKGKIDQIINNQEITPNTILFLLNAIYFKGLWTTQFDKTKTRELPFTLINGLHKHHPIMFRQAEYQYYTNELFQAVSLPYGQGRFSLYIFLPQKNINLKTFYKSLNPENWEQWMNQFRPQQLLLGLPRFRLNYGLELNNILKSLGMAIAFDRNRANFKDLTPLPAYISKVKHNTFFEVNEEGSEASGATSVQIATRGLPPQLIVDRPFFCAIRDNQTKSILFMGSVVEP